MTMGGLLNPSPSMPEIKMPPPPPPPAPMDTPEIAEAELDMATPQPSREHRFQTEIQEDEQRYW